MKQVRDQCSYYCSRHGHEQKFGRVCAKTRPHVLWCALTARCGSNELCELRSEMVTNMLAIEHASCGQKPKWFERNECAVIRRTFTGESIKER